MLGLFGKQKQIEEKLEAQSPACSLELKQESFYPRLKRNYTPVYYQM